MIIIITISELASGGCDLAHTQSLVGYVPSTRKYLQARAVRQVRTSTCRVRPRTPRGNAS